MSARVVRLLQMLETLGCAAGGPDALARDLGVSRRTIFRDLQALREAGVQIKFNNDDKKYFVDKEARLRPTLPSAADLLELLRQSIATAIPSSQEQLEQSRRAASVLASHLSPNVAEHLNAIRDCVASPIREPQDRSLRDVFDRVVEAFEHGCCLTLELREPHDPRPIALKVEPIALHRSDREWLLRGRSVPGGDPIRICLSAVEYATLASRSGEPLYQQTPG